MKKKIISIGMILCIFFQIINAFAEIQIDKSFIEEVYYNDNFDDDDSILSSVTGGDCSIDVDPLNETNKVFRMVQTGLPAPYPAIKINNSGIHGTIIFRFRVYSEGTVWIRGVFPSNVRAANLTVNNAEKATWHDIIYVVNTDDGTCSVKDNDTWLIQNEVVQTFETRRSEWEMGLRYFETSSTSFIYIDDLEILTVKEMYEALNSAEEENINQIQEFYMLLGQLDDFDEAYNNLCNEEKQQLSEYLFKNKSYECNEEVRKNFFDAFTQIIDQGVEMKNPVLLDADNNIVLKMTDGGQISELTFYNNNNYPYMYNLSVFIALYSDNRILSVNEYNVGRMEKKAYKNVKTAFNFPENTENITYKIFLWNKSQYKPLDGAIRENKTMLTVFENVSEDTFCITTNPNYPVCGCEDYVWVNTNSIGFLKFGLGYIKDKDLLMSARLRINQTSSTGSELNVSHIKSDWSEKTLQYINLPEDIMIEKNTAMLYTSGAGIYECDVTSAVKSAISMGNNVSFMLDSQNVFTSFTSGNVDDQLSAKLILEFKEVPYSFYSQEAEEMLKNSLILYLNSNSGYKNNTPFFLDEDVTVFPFKNNGEIYIPQSCCDTIGIFAETDIMINDTKYVDINKLTNKYVYTNNDIIIISNDEISVSDALYEELKNSKFILTRKATGAAVSIPEVDVRSQSTEQKERFNNRDNDIEALGEKFFALLDLEKEELSDIKRFVEAKDYERAFKLFRSRFVKNLREMDFFTLYTLAAGYQTTALNNLNSDKDDIMNGIFTAKKMSNDYITVKLGNPGEVNWNYLTDEFTDENFVTYGGCDTWGRGIPVNLFTFAALLTAAVETKNAAYLDRWFEYSDDLYLNIDGVAKPDAIDDGDMMNPQTLSIEIMKLMYRLQRAFDILPENGEGVSETALARFLMLVIEDYMPKILEVNRFYLQNWGFHNVTLMPVYGKVFKDFKAGDLYTQAGLDYARSWKTQSFYSDGTDREQAWGYNNMLSSEWKQDVKGLKELGVETEKTEFDNYINLLEEMYSKRDIYMLRHLNGNGASTAPALWGANETNSIADRKLGNDNSKTDEDPVARSIIDYVLNSGKEPEYLDDSQPYGGFYMIRGGWNPKSQIGVMYSNNKEHEADWMNMNQAFHLTAFGQDLLLAANNNSYQSVHGPVKVDGMYPSQPAVLCLGHRNLGLGKNEVSGFKNYSSDKFGYMQGVYNQEWNSDIGYVSNYTGSLMQQSQKIKNIVYGIKNNREITYLRELGIWIVADSFIPVDNKEHTWQTEWNFPCDSTRPVSYLKNYCNNGDYKVFLAEEINADESAQSIKTQADNQANVSVYQQGTSKFTYQKKLVNKMGGYSNLSNIYQVTNTISGNGNQGLITVIYPRENIDNDISNIEYLQEGNVIGISALNGNNNRMLYKMSVNGANTINADSFDTVAQSILITERDGVYNGMVMDCTSISFGGKRLWQGEKADFEFSLSDGVFTKVNEIYSSMNTPVIEPNVSSFKDSIEISISHELGDEVYIIYTTDGEEPRIGTAKVYTGSFSITDTTIVKARAVRKGIETEQMTSSCVYESATSRAEFTKISEKTAVDVIPENLVRGMNYEYFEGNWEDLFNYVENIGVRLTPVKTGVCGLMDISQRQIHKEPASKNEAEAFAFRYYGYMKVEGDGYYTFHAPEEFYLRNINAGYNLALFVDGEKWTVEQDEHATGTWTVYLKNGYHEFEVRYTDYRKNNSKIHFGVEKATTIYFDRENPQLNYREEDGYAAGIPDTVYSGDVPEIKLSYGEKNCEKIPENILYYR